MDILRPGASHWASGFFILQQRRPDRFTVMSRRNWFAESHSLPYKLIQWYRWPIPHVGVYMQPYAVEFVQLFYYLLILGEGDYHGDCVALRIG
jgi:hypothetical protein